MLAMVRIAVFSRVWPQRGFAAALTLGVALGGLPSTASAAASTVAAAPTTPEQRAQARYQAGLQAFEAGRYAEAAEAFEDAFELAGDPTLLYNVSIAYEKAGNLAKALETLDQYAQLAPASELEDIDRQRAALRLRIEKAEEEADEPPGETGETTAPPTAPPETDPKRRRDKSVPEKVFTPVAAALVGVTGVALAVGLGLAIPAAQANGEVEDECVEDGGSYLCQDGTASTVDRRRGLAIGADVAFGVGIVTGIAAIAVIARNATRIRRARSTPPTAMLVPSVGRSSAGLSLLTRF